MESEYAFYIKYGRSFPNAGRLVNEPLMDRWFNDSSKLHKASQILHMTQFNKAFKLHNPPGMDWQANSFDKYNSFFDREGNHPLDPPV